jgi:molybdopterin-guanine dinucleotide biosynthesis protein A
MPVIGFWPVALAGQLDAHFAASEDRSMRAWARAVGAVAVSLGGPMPNVNTPADLAKLRRP